MFNIFKSKKQPKPAIRFFSIATTANTLYPITPASELKRTWVSDEKHNFNEKIKKCPVPHQLRITKCPALTEYMNTGFILYAPADFKVNVSDSGKISTESNKLFEWEYIQLHDPEHGQWLLDSSKEYTSPVVLKVNTPWRAVVDPDIVFLQTKVHFNKEPRFTAATGIFDPRLAYEMNIQLFWHVKRGEEVVKAGTPLVQYIPLSRKMLMSTDYSIGDLTEMENRMEMEFRYAQNCSMRDYTTVATRQLKTSKITDKYRKAN